MSISLFPHLLDFFKNIFFFKIVHNRITSIFLKKWSISLFRHFLNFFSKNICFFKIVHFHTSWFLDFFFISVIFLKKKISTIFSKQNYLKIVYFLVFFIFLNCAFSYSLISLIFKKKNLQNCPKKLVFISLFPWFFQKQKFPNFISSSHFKKV